jgi:hypothetical protein
MFAATEPRLYPPKSLLGRIVTRPASPGLGLISQSGLRLGLIALLPPGLSLLAPKRGCGRVGGFHRNLCVSYHSFGASWK